MGNHLPGPANRPERRLPTWCSQEYSSRMSAGTQGQLSMSSGMRVVVVNSRMSIPNMLK